MSSQLFFSGVQSFIFHFCVASHVSFQFSPPTHVHLIFILYIHNKNNFINYSFTFACFKKLQLLKENQIPTYTYHYFIKDNKMYNRNHPLLQVYERTALFFYLVEQKPIPVRKLSHTYCELFFLNKNHKVKGICYAFLFYILINVHKRSWIQK